MDGQVLVSLRLPAALVASVDAAADVAGLSRSAAVRQLLGEALRARQTPAADRREPLADVARRAVQDAGEPAVNGRLTPEPARRPASEPEPEPMPVPSPPAPSRTATASHDPGGWENKSPWRR